MAAPSASSEPVPAGPAVAAVLSLAAGLAELTASLAGEDELVARARELRAEADELGRRDAEAYAERLRTGGAAAREQTIEIPLRMAEVAAGSGELAATAAERGERDWRYDAVAGAILAEGAANAAALLVSVNAGRSDERAARARDLAGKAGAEARRAQAV